MTGEEEVTAEWLLRRRARRGGAVRRREELRYGRRDVTARSAALVLALTRPPSFQTLGGARALRLRRLLSGEMWRLERFAADLRLQKLSLRFTAERKTESV